MAFLKLEARVPSSYSSLGNFSRILGNVLAKFDAEWKRRTTQEDKNSIKSYESRTHCEVTGLGQGGSGLHAVHFGRVCACHAGRRVLCDSWGVWLCFLRVSPLSSFSAVAISSFRLFSDECTLVALVLFRC